MEEIEKIVRTTEPKGIIRNIDISISANTDIIKQDAITGNITTMLTEGMDTASIGPNITTGINDIMGTTTTNLAPIDDIPYTSA